MSDCAISRIVAAERNSLAAIQECKINRETLAGNSEKIGLLQRQVLQQQEAIASLVQDVALLRHKG